MKVVGIRFHFLAAALIIATALLGWFGYRATSEWQHSTRLLVERRAVEVSTLTITALSRDMRGAQSQVLPQIDPLSSSVEPYALRDEIEKAFVRFPYVESFFTWSANGNGFGSLYLFTRADRPPAWSRETGATAEFPVTVVKNPQELAEFIPAIIRQASFRARSVIFETTIQGESYQVIARPTYRGSSNATLFDIAGFMVNMDWVRKSYFMEMTDQISRIVDGEHSMSLQILDENGKVVASSRPANKNQDLPEMTVREQHFPLFFFDPALRATLPDDVLPVRIWTARVQALQDASMLSAANGARRTFTAILVAAIAALVALLLTARVTRAAAILATMKSDFVSTVTHELKTPLSSIRLVSETLATGRFSSKRKISEYAGHLLADVSRLTRTVDNLLTFSRLADLQQFYRFEAVDPTALMNDAMLRFESQLGQQQFEVAVDVPISLPAIRADRTAILHVFENLLDNAIRYSNGTLHLSVSAIRSPDTMLFRIADKGTGIPADEIPRVFEKFFRGRNVSSPGSGLGLAIVDRIVRDHGGSVSIESVVGSGTTVQVALPLASRVHEASDYDRRR
jgi:signal transduction histidine kinase